MQKQTSSTLPLEVQCRRLLQGIKNRKKDLQSANKQGNHGALQERELERILFPHNDDYSSMNKLLKSNSCPSTDGTTPGLHRHKKQILQEISKVKQIKELISNYQDFVHDTFVLQSSQAQEHDPDITNKANKLKNQVLNPVFAGANKENECLSAKHDLQKKENLQPLVTPLNASHKVNYNIQQSYSIQMSHSTSKTVIQHSAQLKNKYTVDLRRLVQESKALRSNSAKRL